MRTSEKSPEESWNPSTSFAEASHANPSLARDAGAPRPMNGGSGRSSPGSFAYFDPATCSLRTSQTSLFEEGTTFSGILPPSGSMRNGRLFRRRSLVPRTFAVGCGLLPTPQVSRSYEQRSATGARIRRPSLLGLASKGLLLAKLQAFFAAGGRVATPRASDARRGRWSSPKRPLSTRPLCEQLGGPLDPRFVEWLMAFPDEWTALPDSATPSCLSSQNGSDDSSSNTPAPQDSRADTAQETAMAVPEAKRISGKKKQPAETPAPNSVPGAGCRVPSNGASDPAPGTRHPAPMEVPDFPLALIDVVANARQEFDGERLAELAASLETHGMLEPVVLSPKGSGRYDLVAGERRVRAATLAGLTEVPAILRRVRDERERLQLQMVENLQREDLSPIEEGQALESLLGKGMTEAEIAASVGKSRSWVANRRRLLDLPLDVREMVARREVTIEDGLALLTQAQDPETCLGSAIAMRDGRLRGKDLWARARSKDGVGVKGGAVAALPVPGAGCRVPGEEEDGDETPAVLHKTEAAPVELPTPPAIPEPLSLPDPALGTRHPAPASEPLPSARTLAREAARMLKAVEARRREEGALLRDPKAVAVIVQRVLSGTRLAAIHRMLARLAGEYPLPFALTRGDMDRPAEEILEALATVPPEVQMQLAFWALVEEEASVYEGSGERMRRGPWYAGVEGAE
jgi:ParB/RepB/Spo0J family partition protein